MSRRKILCALITAACVTPGYSAEFAQSYFFGDSLTDAGSFGQRFTVNPGQVWAQELAALLGTSGGAFGLFNPAAVPGTLVQPLGGTNYAQGGARVTEFPGVPPESLPGAIPLKNQVDTFLGVTPAANPNALYAVWGGANDVFFQAGLAGAGAITSAEAQTNIRTAAAALVQQIGRLQASGARYVLMPNLPDIGKTPAVILQGIASAGAALGAPATTIQQAQGAATLALRQETTTAAQQTAAQQAAVAAAAGVLGVPASVIQGAADQVRTGFSGLANLYNLALNGAIAQSGLSVIPVNVTGLFNEVIANPAAFGITNVTAPACNTASAITCNAAVAGQLDTAQAYLFADGVHPTPEVHAILARAMLAQLNAPQQISLLSYVGQKATEVQVNTIQEQFRLQRSAHPGSSSGVNVFISGGYQTTELDATARNPGVEITPINLTLGAEVQLNARSSAGVAWSLSQGSADFSGGGGFDYGSNLLGLYFGMDGPFWYNSVLGLGFNDYTDVTRPLALGTTARAERGTTSGNVVLLGLETGYDLKFGNVTTGPVLNALYQQHEVNGYTEDSETSTAMEFGDHKRKSLLTGLGWRATVPVTTSWGQIEPYLKASLFKENEDQDGAITAKLVGLNGSFAIPGIAPDDQYTQIDAGVRAKLSANSAAGLNVVSTVGQDDASHTQFSVSYTRQF
ncbi:MAG: autotransporter domain-containing protein [Thiotrichales bacterium]